MSLFGFASRDTPSDLSGAARRWFPSELTNLDLPTIPFYVSVISGQALLFHPARQSMAVYSSPLANAAHEEMMTSTARANASVYCGLFLITAATLVFEILLTRIFSISLWYHFAFMAISVAMFGITVGALIVHCGLRGFQLRNSASAWRSRHSGSAC
jgi:hypothetical protein